MAIATHKTREEKFKWLTRPFIWAFDACLMAALFGVSFATAPDFIPIGYVAAGLIASLLIVAALVVWGIIRMRATYEG
jgi:hypothetical protein